MKLTAIKYGETEITQRMAFQDGSENVKIPIALLFFLLETENKKILIDVGCDTMPGFELKKFELPVTVLERYGIRREEITDVIITHAHHDHIDAIRYYPQADVYIHKDGVKEAEKYAPDISKIIAVENVVKLCGGVVIKHIGGHSPDSCVVLIEGASTTYVLCGDECYTKENLLKNKPTGSSCCIAKSIEFVAEYRKEKYIPVLFHDIKLVVDENYRVLYEN